MNSIETQYPRYTNLDGYIFFVGKGLWGSQYMTFKKSSADAPGTHRVISPNLPPRETTQEAQADLDEYAVAHNLAVYDYQAIEAGEDVCEALAVHHCTRPEVLETYNQYYADKGDDEA